MSSSTLTAVAIVLAVSSLILLVFMYLDGRKSRLDKRLQDLTGAGAADSENETMVQFAQSALPHMAKPLVPEGQEERTRLQARLVHAGLYGRQGMQVFLGVKMVLIVVPAFLAVLAGILNIIPLDYGLIGGTFLGFAGILGPSIWLRRRTINRQQILRRAIPDALDMLVICLEGGLSLPGSLRRIAGELRSAHPLLASELSIVQREVQLGLSTGESLREFGSRADLDEIRNLASVILQSERYGASLVKALRVHADTLRQKRMYYAEEMAQKAATKMLFPTLLLIFPGIFIVVLGPAVFIIFNTLKTMR
jgi:tight adherence protein C